MGALTQQKKYVGKFINNAKMGSDDVLWVFGAYYKQNSDSVKNLAMVLKAAYDEDWLEEEKIINYYEDSGTVDEESADDEKENKVKKEKKEKKEKKDKKEKKKS